MKNRGFTFIEIVIAIAIITILAVIASTSYLHQVTASRRAEGETGLLELANQLEQYHLLNNTYADATFSNLHTLAVSPNGYYNMSMDKLSENDYELSAEPLFVDPVCDKFILKQSGEKSFTGNGASEECW